MKVLVTGGAGFIGSHLIRRFLAQGDSVTVLDNATAGGTDRLAGLPVRMITADVRDPNAVTAAMSGQEAVFHLAAVVGVPNAMRHQWDSLTTNVLGTYNVLEAARKGDVPIFLASSSAIYGKLQRIPVREKDDVVLGNTHRSAWTYSYAKLTEELLARAAAAEWQVRVKIGRLFNVIGPGQSGAYGMVVPRFVAKALRGEPLLVYGDGTQTRTFLDVEDAVDGIMTVWERGEWGQTYNVGGQGETRVLDLARMVIRLTGTASEIEFVPFHVAFDANFEETNRRVPCIDRLAELGYEPKYTLEDTLRRVIADTSGHTASPAAPSPRTEADSPKEGPAR